MAVQSLRALTYAESGDMTWVMVNKNDPKTLKNLKAKFGFHDIDLDDTAPPIQSPKIAVRDDYIFMILQFPVFDRGTRIIKTAEVDFYIEKNLLVTVDTNRLVPLQEMYEAFQRSKGKMIKEGLSASDVPHLIYLVLDELLTSIFPMIRHIASDIENIETELFRDSGKDLIRELLRVKTNIVNIRKSMQGHKAVIRKLIEVSEDRFQNIKRFEEYLDRLVDITKDIWDNLQLHKETIDALHGTKTSLDDLKMNEIMKTLTMFSVIIFPLTLFATLFAMRTNGMPLVDSPYAFWIIVVFLIVFGSGMLFFFRHKKWL